MSEIYNEQSDNQYVLPTAPPIASRTKQGYCILFLLGLGLFWVLVVLFLIYKCA